MTIAAQREIRAGEEITLDQATWNFEYDEYTDRNRPCGCGTPGCRGQLTRHDWRVPALRARYRGHFHPMVQALIDAEEA